MTLEAAESSPAYHLPAASFLEQHGPPYHKGFALGFPGHTSFLLPKDLVISFSSFSFHFAKRDFQGLSGLG